MIDRILRLLSTLRGSHALRPLEPLFLRVQPRWDDAVELLSRRRGYLAHVNGDPLRVVYRYGARYEKTGYEPAVHRAFTTGIEPGMVVLDVGAHIGFFALAAALRVGPSGKVYAFEPAPRTSTLLERHVRMNGMDERVEVVACVVTDHDGETSFYVAGETMAAAVFRESVDVLSPEHHGRPADEHRLRATTVDAFCRDRGIRPSRIKIDVEGAELAVLRGATETLRGDAELVCEVHPAALRYLGGSVAEVETLLGAGGRTVETIDAPNNQGIFHLVSRPSR